MSADFWQLENVPVAWAVSQIRYVAPGGDCGAVSPCYATIQAAVDAASAGDAIKIAEGIYTSEALQVIYVNKSITLSGGYTTADWNSSDPLNQPTVIDAEEVERRRGIVVDGTGVATITLTGLTVKRGGIEVSEGGGVYVENGTIILSDNVIHNNKSSHPGGSGVFVNDGTVTLNNNVIEDNSLASWGGGVFVSDGTVTMNNNTFQGNSASYGGAIFVDGGSVILNSNTIQDNSASSYGGGVYISYGSVVTLNHNIIQGNSTTFRSGGGVSAGGTVTMDSNTIQNNFAGDNGGGLSIGNGSTTMNNNIILDNTANASGGGIAISGSSVVVNAQNEIIANNTSLWDGVYLSGGTLTAYHWTLVDNGKYALTTDGGAANLTNTIVVSHALAGFWGRNIVADHTLYFNNGTPCGGGASCTNSFTGGPKFINPAAENYHIDTDSAAVDKGVDVGVMIDIDGDIRPQGIAPDLGADEVLFPLSISKVGPTSVIAGGLITYTLTIANNSSETFSSLIITDVGTCSKWWWRFFAHWNFYEHLVV